MVSAALFWLIHVVPGDPGRNALGPYATESQVAAWNSAHGAEAGPLEGYVSWLAGFATGDWGVSLVYDVPVLGLVMGRFVNSVALGVLAFALLVPLAIGIGALQARTEGSRGDRATTVTLMTLASVPEFVIGVVFLIVFAVVLPIAPVRATDGLGSGVVLHVGAMLLPALTLALGTVSIVARTARSSIIDTTRAPFYRAAVVRGLSGGELFRRHVARNALGPTIAVLGLCLGVFIGGSAVVETLFGYPGLGELLVTATQRKDLPVLTAGVMVTGFVSLAALLATDLALAAVDPRVRLSEGS
ncbi:ABC transporter permease [Microbacterium awajiense]|uniref:ABC transporter permease n=2 Tax=Microbacterium awajiense TaxID=415214 RepID=A0ABP7AVC2_9MICO